MPIESELVARGYRPGSPRQRIVSSLLSAAIIAAVLLLAIYTTGIVPQIVERARTLTTFDVTDHEQDKGGDQPAPKKQEQAKKEEKRKDPKPVTRPEPVVVTKPVEKPVEAKKPAFTFLKMSSTEMAMADIGKMKPAASGGASAAPAGKGGTYGPGEGPGGAVLYNADWFRPPTDAQLGGYLPANRPLEGWGMIACQTEEHYKVDNCQILGESPRGSGFGRAVLNAAWQFEVVPPRINGKPQLGTWVRIRIDYGTRTAG